MLPRPLLYGCRGSFAAALTQRCKLAREGKVVILIRKAYEAQVGLVSKQIKAYSIPSSITSFSKTAWAAILAGAEAVGRACKVAFSYGLESDQEITAKFIFKLTMKERHSHIPMHVSKIIPPANCIPFKAVTDAFSGMPKKSAAHRDGRTLGLPRDAAQTP
jgi:hypothetical protein